MRMNLEGMLEKGLIKKTVPSKQSALRRIGKAERWLALAKKLRDMDLDTALEKTYDAILESGLAVMSKNGYRPTSKLGHHFAVMEYLSSAIDIDSSELHTLRKNRNVVIYEDEEDAVTEEQVDEAIEFAMTIIGKAKKAVGNK